MNELNKLSTHKSCYQASREYVRTFSWVLLSWPLIHKIVDVLKTKEGPIIEVFAGTGWLSYFINPRVAMKFAINRKLKLPIASETIISLLFTLYQY